MGIMEKVFGGKSASITSAVIRDEIDRSEKEIGALQAKSGRAMAGLATMTDAEHVAAEVDIAATKRAIARLDARVAHLNSELSAVVAAEDSSAKAAVDEALRLQAEAMRKANSKEAAKLLADYNIYAAKVGDITSRLAEIAAETNAVNAELRRNAVADSVISFEVLHRKHPDRESSERRELQDVWVDHSGKVSKVERGEKGELIRPQRTFDRDFGVDPEAKLERREVVVSRTDYRAGRYEDPLSGLVLPPGFAGGDYHWPRK